MEVNAGREEQFKEEPPLTEFPDKIYTIKELEAARDAITNGYKHNLRVLGSSNFKLKIKEILKYIELAGYLDFLITYIRAISEINGLSQLRETEASLWLNNYIPENPFEGARFIIQKAEQMKYYLSGKVYYLKGETSAITVSIKFLEELKAKLKREDGKAKCEDVLKQWQGANIV